MAPSEGGLLCSDVDRKRRPFFDLIDFHLSADPIEPGRINVFERWKSVEAVEAFRGSGPSEDQQAVIIEAKVLQYETAGSTSLT